MPKPPPLTDAQIAQLLAETKPVPHKFRQWLVPLPIPNHRQLQINRTIVSGSGKTFCVYARINPGKPNDFSLGLQYVLAGKRVGLLRCNGWHSIHKNQLDRGTPLYTIPANTCHVHVAQERYLVIDKTLETIGFASPTGEYTNFQSALKYMMARYGFVSDITNEPFSVVSQPELPGMEL